MGDTCCICLDNIIIPVEPICFKCSNQNGEISCFSMKRICIKCLQTYLDLEKHRNERSIKKKCVFCPSVVNLQQIAKNDTFRVDYMTMDRENRDTMISCIYPECLFQGNQIQVARHIFSQCEYFFIECLCGYTCRRKDMTAHQLTCDKYEQCQMCFVCVPTTDFNRHMYYSHDKTKCFTCHEYIDMEKLSDHIISECPERLVSCEICCSFIRFKIFKEHLHNHLIEINKNVQIINNKLRAEEETYQRLMKLVNQYEK